MKQLLFPKLRIYQHWKNFLLSLLHKGNLTYLRILLQRRLFGHGLMLLVSNAIQNERPEIFDSTKGLPPCSKNVLHDDSKTNLEYQSGEPIRSNEDKIYEIYLCNYRYEGKTYSVEICATSFEDANARCRALQHGEIIGVLRMNIPVNESWYYSVSRFWKNLFGQI